MKKDHNLVAFDIFRAQNAPLLLSVRVSIILNDCLIQLLASAKEKMWIMSFSSVWVTIGQLYTPKLSIEAHSPFS